MASFLLMPLSMFVASPAYSQENYDFGEIEVYDYSDIYDLTQPPELPVSTQTVTVENSAQNEVYDFSDEAQRAFDAQQKIQTQQLLTDSYPKEKSKKQSKKTKTTVETKNKEHQSEPIVDVFQPEPQPSVSNDYVFQDRKGTLKGSVVLVPAGSSFHAVLQSSISSGSLAKNDTIAAVLQDDWFCNGVLVAPAGSIVYGKAIDAEKAGFAYSNGRLSITFTEILTPKGDQLLLTSNVVTVQMESQRTKKIATRVASGSVIGAVSGILWALISGGDIVNGLAIGAGVGAAGGTIRAVATKGKEVDVEAGTAINVRLIKSMNIQPYEQDEYYSE